MKLSICLLFTLRLTAQLLQPERLQVENRLDPIGIDVTTPRLSWNLNLSGVAQAAYQVQATAGSAILWDSGMVISSQSSGVEYAGPDLQSHMRVVWQVRVWTDPDGAPSEWSSPAYWEMGLLNPSDWQAQWITNPDWIYGQPLPIFARQFSVSKPVSSARLYITGLGIYVATINGQPVTEDLLTPGNTKYATRVEYATNDVTGLLSPGANALGVQLGNGNYNLITTPGHYSDFVYKNPLPLILLAQLEITYSDGTSDTIVSDTSWKTTLGPTIVSTWYGGEEYDARREQAGWDQPGADLSAWDSAALSAPPGTNTQLSWRPAPPVRMVGTVTPQAITQPQPGVYVFDMGVNFAGLPQLRVSGPAGTRVTMMIAETLAPDGTVDQSQITPDYPVLDSYTLSGKGVETWRPQFEYHGFRYLQVSGLPGPPDTSVITGLMMRGFNQAAGSFTSSNDLLNSIHRIINRAIESNMMTIFTDCPDREKLGWLADMEESSIRSPATTTSRPMPATWSAIWLRRKPISAWCPTSSPSTWCTAMASATIRTGAMPSSSHPGRCIRLMATCGLLQLTTRTCSSISTT